MNAGQGGLRRALQAMLLDGMIRKVGSGANKLNVLVVDRAALRILAAAVPVNELVHEGISIVEMLDMRRQPLPRMRAIYFVTPSAESVQHLAQESATQYKEFHLFFTSRLPDFQMTILRQNTGLLKRVKAFVELGVEFLALESRLFSLDRPGCSLPQLFSGEGKDATTEMTTISERLTEACKLVGPNIEWSVRSDATSRSSRIVASFVKEQLEAARIDSLRKQGNESEAAPHEDSDDVPTKATLLVVDRSSDLVSPLVHDFSYQAMAHDLLKLNYLKPGGAHIEMPDAEDEEKMKSIQLDDEDTDPTWSAIRCMFIEEALKEAQRAFKTFLETDAAFKIRGKDAGDVDVKDMSAAVRSLAKSQVHADKHAMHIKAIRECLAACSHLNLTELALVEQDLVMGRHSDGTKIKSEMMVERIVEIVSNAAIPVAHRARLVMIALAVSEVLVGLGGLKSALASSATFRSRLLRSGFEDVQDMDQMSSSVEGLRKILETARTEHENFAVQSRTLLDADDTVKAKLKNKYMNRQVQKHQAKENAARKKRHGLDTDEERPYDVARYHPPLRSILMDLVDDELDSVAFPSIGSVSVDSIIQSLGDASTNDRSMSERGSSESKNATRFGSTQVRSHSATVSGFVKSIGRRSSDTSGGSSDEEHFRIAERGHLFMVFVVGGVCYPEVKAMYEVCAKREANILIGGSQVLTPSLFTDVLGAVADPVTRIRVMLPPLPLELAQSRAARARALEAGGAREQNSSSAKSPRSHNAAPANAEEDSGDDEAVLQEDVEVVVGYKKSRGKRLFGRKKK